MPEIFVDEATWSTDLSGNIMTNKLSLSKYQDPILGQFAIVCGKHPCKGWKHIVRSVEMNNVKIEPSIFNHPIITIPKKFVVLVCVATTVLLYLF